jgi:hypothetical protein
MLKTLRDIWNSLFGKKAVPVAPKAAPAPVAPKPAFVETFQNLDNWIVSTWSSPQAQSVNHTGIFKADRAVLGPNGLCLELMQTINGDQIVSEGAEISSKQNFGYGDYEFVMKASATERGSPVSGSISGCFSCLPHSETEIDVEVEGGERQALTQLTTWVSDAKPNQCTLVNPAGIMPHEGFHVYLYRWTPGKVEFYINGALTATHTKVVPSKPAPMMFNHWGTNDPNWGGVATPGTERYMYVKSFKHTPL